MACRPRNCSRSWVEMSKKPQGARLLYRHIRPPATVNVGNFAKYFAAAYCTRPAAFWHLPTIRLQQRLGLALGRLPGLGLLPGLDLVLLLSLECPGAAAAPALGCCCSNCSARGRNRADTPRPNPAAGPAAAPGLSRNGTKHESAAPAPNRTPRLLL